MFSCCPFHRDQAGATYLFATLFAQITRENICRFEGETASPVDLYSKPAANVGKQHLLLYKNIFQRSGVRRYSVAALKAKTEYLYIQDGRSQPTDCASSSNRDGAVFLRQLQIFKRVFARIFEL